MSLGKSLGRSNQRGSNTPQACYGHPRCNLNLVRPLCRFLDAFSFSLIHHAAINLQPPSHAVLYQTPRSCAAVLQSSVISNTLDDPLPRSPSIISLSPPAQVFPRSPALQTWPFRVTCGRPCEAAPPTTTIFSCARLLRYSQTQFARGRLRRRGCTRSATCTRILGFDATSCDALHGACCSGP